MPELPEIYSRANEMNAALPGKVIQNIDILQPKCLNIEPEAFKAALVNATLREVKCRGKWIFVDTDQGWLLLNLGMGGEILLIDQSQLPEKRRLVFDFTDGTCLSVNFWWFGYAHFVPDGQLATHQMSSKLGPNVIDIPRPAFHDLFRHQRGKLKAFLLDQSKLAGIGNAYIHDILFFACLHPNRPIASLTPVEVDALFDGIQKGLLPALEKGGAFYEVNIFGQKGGFTSDDIIVGYREGKPCPNCGTLIVKIKTGSTSSFICPQCQI